MPRHSCLDCARKHLAQAIVLETEDLMGYAPLHKWLAVGHMAEAEAELIDEYPNLAHRIRVERLNYIEFNVGLNSLCDIIIGICKEENIQIDESKEKHIIQL